MPTVQSVHSPTVLDNISVRGTGKKYPKTYEILDYANSKGISFVSAYRELMSNAYKCKDKEA